jgi:hypothetical protein
MDARRHQDVAACPFDIDARGGTAFREPPAGGPGEEIVKTTTSRLLDHGIWQRAVVGDQIVETVVARVPWIYVQDPETRPRPARDADVRLRCSLPPSTDHIDRDRCIVYAP